MKSIPVEDSVGLILCHDITEIVPGKHKKPAFRRGHIVREEDIEHLLRLGKEHLYVWDTRDKSLVHEDDAALRIARAVAGSGVSYGKPTEGRINFTASHQGLLTINLEMLDRVNSIPDVTLATAHTMQEVAEGRQIAGTRVIPLVVPESTVKAVEEAVTSPFLEVLPFMKHKVAIITTGSEVYHGRVKDGFGPVLRKKLDTWGSEVLWQKIVPDEGEETTKALKEAVADGASIITVTGGMSVDPDDKTPAAIRAAGCDIISYGAPVFPGAMFLMGYIDKVAVMGLPGCVMYHRASIFDLIMPRILAGMHITKYDITRLAHGGLCENCKSCHYPVCAFGKGII